MFRSCPAKKDINDQYYDAVSFEVEKGKKGLSAINVKRSV